LRRFVPIVVYMPVWGVLVVYALAVARLTGFLAVDEVTRPARDALLRRLDENRPEHVLIAYLAECQWCVSLWVAIVIAPVSWLWGTQPWLVIPALALAYSQLAGMTSKLGRG
jgi:hypothetical protein